MPWTLEQHLQWMANDGIQLAPRYGDGTEGNSWRNADGTPVVRDAAAELAHVRDYLAKQPASYRALLAAMAEKLPPMSEACRAVSLIPSRNEGQYIERLLSLLADQRDLSGAPLESSLFEVQLLCNRLHGEEADDTVERLKIWRQRNRIQPLVIDYVHPPNEPVPLTMSRKILSDLALWRAAARPAYRHPLYLLSEDADLLWIDPRQVAIMIERLDAAPGLDVIRGQQDRCPWVMAEYPLLFLMRRSWNFTETFAARRSLWPDRNEKYDFNWNRIVTSGWNTAITAEVYARIGGYTTSRRFEEDMDIGEKISCLRGYEMDGRFVPQVATTGWIPTRSEGSPRRWLHRLLTGLEPYSDENNYENFFAIQHEEWIKQRSLEEMTGEVRNRASMRAENTPELERMLQNDYRFLIKVLKDQDRAAYAYGRVLFALGFKPHEVEIAGETVRVRSLEGARARLESYAARYVGVEVGDYPASLPLGSRRTNWTISIL